VRRASACLNEVVADRWHSAVILILSILLLRLTEAPAATLTRAPSTSVVLVGAADIANCDERESELTERLVDRIPGTVFTAGDNAYAHGTAQEFVECYGLTWGRHRARTRPAPGNHDYESPQAAPYFNYFGGNAGPAGRGYYSYDIGAWHVMSLNSNQNAKNWGAAQEDWLRGDLQANRSNCIAAYWHHPRFSSGNEHGNATYMNALYKILYEHGVSLLISGHDHIYERFAPQDPYGKADARGVRQFIVGTGGARLYSIDKIQANSQVRNTTAHGVLKLTLLANHYEWEFIPVAGQVFHDRGTAPCSAAAKSGK
jgi:Calcineurin-like phosphoesterase